MFENPSSLSEIAQSTYETLVHINPVARGLIIGALASIPIYRGINVSQVYQKSSQKQQLDKTYSASDTHKK